MEDYKPNSKRYKAEQQVSAKDKKIEKVVSGTAKTKKKSEIRKLTDVFVSEDISNVKSYALMEVLVPAVKKAIFDIVTNGIDMILYGETGHSKKRGSASRIEYNRCYDRPSDRRSSGTYRGRSGLDYDDIIFDNRGDAEAVLSAMDEIIAQYSVVSVGDLYDLADISTSNYAVNNYGWTDIRGASVVRVRDGYTLKLPRALPINQ